MVSAIVALTATLAGHAAEAQTYPTRPITVIIPFAGGSASDVVTRIMLERMSRSMGQPIIVDNRPGAGGNTGTAAAAKAAPDGYTLVGSGSGPVAANRTLYRDLGYDPEKDFEAISPFALFTIIVVASAQLPVKTLPELVAYAKERPDQLNYGSVGIGSSQHLGGAYFEQVAGRQAHPRAVSQHRPYTRPDLIAGTVPLGFQWFPNVSAPLASGGAKAIAVAGKKRLAALPDVPTAAEAGLPSYEHIGLVRACWRRAERRSRSSPSSIRSSPRRSRIRRCASGSTSRAQSRSRSRPRRPSKFIVRRDAQVSRDHHEGGDPADPVAAPQARGTTRSTCPRVATSSDTGAGPQTELDRYDKQCRLRRSDISGRWPR